MKKSNSLSIYKKTIQKYNSVHQLHNCTYNDTKEVWLAKVFNYEELIQHKMQTVIQFNQEVFSNMREKQYVLYLKEVVERNDNFFFVFQKFTIRLSQYIRQNAVIPKEEVQKILIQIFRGISQIYQEDYIIRNLCPQNIVFSDSQQKWKIESIVFDCDNYQVQKDNEYQYKGQWASNQEKLQLDNLDDDLADEQMVWNLGILALRLTLGSSFKLNKKFVDSDLNLQLIRQKTTPKVFELISKSIKQKQRDRIQLSQFFKLKIFQSFIPQVSTIQKFSSSSKIWKNKSQIIKRSAIQKSQIRQSTIIRKPKVVQTQKQFSKQDIDKFQNVYHWQLQKCLFFAQIKKYTNQSLPSSIFSNDDSSILRYIFTKISHLNLKQLQKQLQSGQLNEYSHTDSYKFILQQVKMEVGTQQKLSQTLLNKLSKMSNQKLKVFASQTQILNKLKNDDIELDSLFILFNKVAGVFYSQLKSFVDNQKNVPSDLIEQIQRIMCFIVFSVCLIYENQNDLQKDFLQYRQSFEQQNLRKSLNEQNLIGKYVRLIQYLQQERVIRLICHSQRLLKKYFQITVVNN